MLSGLIVARPLMRDELAYADDLLAPSPPAEMVDDDPAAPWNQPDAAEGGMQSATNRRRSWEAGQRRKPLAEFSVIEGDRDTEADEPPAPNGPEEYGLPPDDACERAEVINPATPEVASLTATVWQHRDPATIPPRQWLYGHHLIRAFPSATVAPGGLGKSSLVLVETIAMVTGRRLLGKWLKEPLRAWYWNLEDPDDEIDRRLAAICLQYGISAADIDGRLHVNGRRSQPCVVAKMVGNAAVILEPIVDALVAEIIAKKIDVLTIDPFVSCHEIPENDNGAMDRVVKAWGRVAHRANCAIELVHHTRKSGDGGNHR